MITYEEYFHWCNSAGLDRTVGGALATRMALRIFPFLVAKVSDAQDAARAKFYLELASCVSHRTCGHPRFIQAPAEDFTQPAP